MMRQVSLLILLCAFCEVTFASNELSATCVKDSDCVVFIDECEEMHAVNYLHMKDQILKKLIRDQKYYTWKTEMICGKEFIQQPLWKKQPKLKCKKGLCQI